ncbi:putative disease resistance protein RPP13-like [Capsicum annuum]|nr:putative disease resistance protein RPP13-like [Capsicum annuum]
MADAFVSFAVQKLGDFLIQEVNLRLGLREDVQWLRNELLFMQSFIKHAEENPSRDQRVQQWVFEINSVANDAVAILETYSFGASDVDGFASRLKACTCICTKETKFYKVGKEIQSLKQRIMDISRKRETYGITDINNAPTRPNNQSAMVRTLRRTTSYVDDQDRLFVGFREVVEILLAELLKEEPRRSVISIFGMGGLGKTTLARNLYTNPNIVSSFPTRAWICVSQEYNTMDLLRNIIKSIQRRTKENIDLLEKMTETDLESYLRDLLKEDKYLVVVDDVWRREAWESLKRAFPDSKSGSRVIITTRKEDVAERADNKGFVHKLRYLSQEESWDLFCKKLLDVQAMVSAMERLAKDMVDKCGGLPLAIVVLSGLLSHKKGLEEWKKVKTQLWQNIKDDSLEISFLLSLSYNDLPTALKQCFLSFGMFPEDYVIYAENIIWMWMAEGFIPRGEERMEDVGEGFLNELIRLKLDTIRCLYHLKFLRLKGIHELPSSIGNLKNLQTIRVLNNFGRLCQLPPETADLINLRHLEASYSKPLKHISKLTGLQVINGICCDQWKDVDPVDLVNLQDLRMYGIMKSYSLNNISSLKNLIILRLFCKDDESFPALEFLNSFQKLQKLWLNGRIEKLPLSNPFPNSITMMILSHSELMGDPMPILGMLPNLRNLDLLRAYEGKEITCSGNDFCQLEFLHLESLENLERWNLATNAMPLIKGLGIHNCPKLREIPERMKEVERLARTRIG